MIQIYYNGNLLGEMDKYDSRQIREYWNRQGSCEDDWLGLQSKYQAQFKIDDLLDFVEPNSEEA
tara:strand:- start:23 stop:214 length:192 start_codon:yes stop_codon:yes gene_type:complete